jgi:electron transfer flavoprotein alpha/beta subunit
MISQTIKDWIDKTGFDLILCGARSQDTGSGFMVSALSQSLNIAAATGIIKLEIDADDKLIAHKKLPKGERETYGLEMPAIIGVEEGINEPRYVAPFSRTYREGLQKKVEFIQARPNGLDQRIRFLYFTQARPRVKVGINISGLSKEETRKMMRGELGRKKELFYGPADEAAKRIFDQIRGDLK